mmetsp:Transcript_24676/g.38775  ORF Transcript_24676/g.38775 Transcript_24676/m.38775 type:complete len:523 (+) Transcript_24676:311-1879(+)
MCSENNKHGDQDAKGTQETRTHPPESSLALSPCVESCPTKPWEDDAGPLLEPSKVRQELSVIAEYSLPIVVANFLMMVQSLICLFFVGKLGELALASTGLALMFCNVTGLSMFVGLASGLDTFATQYFGASEYRLVGVVLQRTLLIVEVAVLPVAVVWSFSAEILGACGVPQEVTDLVGPFTQIMALGLPALAAQETIKRYLQAQGIMSPLVWLQGIVDVVHFGACWLFLGEEDLLGLNLKTLGAAVANVWAMWFGVTLLVGYTVYFKLHAKTWFGWTLECAKGIPEFLSIAVPSCAMLCMEWWAFELSTLISGRLGTLSLASQTVLFNATALFYMVPLGVSTAAATRVGNSIGAGKAKEAQRASVVCLCTVSCATITLSIVYYIFKREFVLYFAHEEEVISLITSVIPIQASFLILDAIAGVLQGILRGIGKQHIGFYVNLVAFYVIALPLGTLLCFHFDMKLHGLWVGLMFGSGFQCLGIGGFLLRVSWDLLAQEASTRRVQEPEASKELEDRNLLSHAV